MRRLFLAFVSSLVIVWGSRVFAAGPVAAPSMAAVTATAEKGLPMPSLLPLPREVRPLRMDGKPADRLPVPPAPGAQEKAQGMLQVNGLLLDSRGEPLHGTFLLQFRVVDPAMDGWELWRTSQYVPVKDGEYHAVLRIPKEISPSGIPPGWRVLAEPPQGTRWTVKSLPFFVQVGSFAKEKRAQKLAEELAPEFSRTFVTAAKVQDGDVHQVRIGPFELKNDAEDAAWWLNSIGHEAIVVKAER